MTDFGGTSTAKPLDASSSTDGSMFFDADVSQTSARPAGYEKALIAGRRRVLPEAIRRGVNIAGRRFRKP